MTWVFIELKHCYKNIIMYAYEITCKNDYNKYFDIMHAQYQLT